MAENTNTEREAFEQWAAKNIGRIWRSSAPGSTDDYEDASTNIGWRAFQAGRASLSLPAAGQEPVAWMDDRGLVVSAEWLASEEATSDYRAAYNIPLYAAPQPAAPVAGQEPVATDEDGERYRYLIEALDEKPHGKPTLGASWDDDIGFWTAGSFFGLKDKASIDAAIDAIRKQRGET